MEAKLLKNLHEPAAALNKIKYSEKELHYYKPMVSDGDKDNSPELAK